MDCVERWRMSKQRMPHTKYIWYAIVVIFIGTVLNYSMIEDDDRGSRGYSGGHGGFVGGFSGGHK